MEKIISWRLVFGVKENDIKDTLKIKLFHISLAQVFNMVTPNKTYGTKP